MMSHGVHRGVAATTDAGDALGKHMTTICPTLYIGLGRTGREVLRKLRRRLIDATAAAPQSAEPLTDFPFNAFLLFDRKAFLRNQEEFLRDRMRTASAWAHDDLEFRDDEIIDCDFWIDKYVRDADSLKRYPVIADWMGAQDRISELIGHIERAPHHSPSVFDRPRWWSRLGTFDAQQEIRDRIRSNLDRLKRSQFKKEVAELFGHRLCSDRPRVVIVCSLAGQVGSGSFLDFGWLASWLARDIFDSVHVDLVATLPFFGPDFYNQANAYAALMELETTMRGHSVGRFISRWAHHDRPEGLPRKPFDDVYLVEPGGGAGQVRDQHDECCYMVANALFDDIDLGGYTRKSWLRAHQDRFKVLPLRLKQSAGRYGAVELTYFKGYSAFGQAELGTQQSLRRDLSALELLADAIDACFGEVPDEVSRFEDGDAKPRSMGLKPVVADGDGITSIVQRDVIELRARAAHDAVLQVKADIRLEWERVRKEIGKGGATLICVEPPAPNDLTADWEDRPMCVLALASELGDRDALLEKLSEPLDRVKWAREAKQKALAKMSKAQSVRMGDSTDPLTASLLQMSASERNRTFMEWLDKSMPWLDVTLPGAFDLNPNQYWCLIGVADARDFEKRFGAEIAAAFATTVAGAWNGNLKFEDMAADGRAMCYVELSGIQMATIRGLEVWHARYLRAREMRDLHTHIDSSQFVHPTVTREVELEAFFDDFKYYLLAVMLHVLTSAPRKSIHRGAYQFTVRTGETLRMGNERNFRKFGLPDRRREEIIVRVNERIAALGKTQLATLAVLAGHYASNVYAPKKVVIDLAGTEEFRQGFGGAVAGEAARELTERALQRGMSEREFRLLTDKALERLSIWAAPIEGSDSDAYEWEVGEADAETGPRLKFFVREELFREDAEDALAEALGLRSSDPRALEPPPLPVDFDLPPCTPPTQYMLVINGEQVGPYLQATVQQLS